MPKLPDPTNAVELNLYPGDTLIIWIDGNSVWALPSSEVGALFVGEAEGPIQGISEKYWKFKVREFPISQS